MEALLEFARGPLFRLSLAVMVLGLIRIVALDLFGAWMAYRRAGDKTIPWGFVGRRTLRWMFPIKHAFTNRPVYGLLSIVFHIGLLLVPLFLYAHVELWRSSLGFGWWTLPKTVADILTITTIITALGLLVGRLTSGASRFISRLQDFMWPLLIALPFVSGLICANATLSAGAYQALMLTHILAAELILTLMPFTKIAHCVLQPLSQLISGIAWRFPAQTDDDICTTLDKKGAKV